MHPHVKRFLACSPPGTGERPARSKSLPAEKSINLICDFGRRSKTVQTVVVLQPDMIIFLLPLLYSLADPTASAVPSLSNDI